MALKCCNKEIVSKEYKGITVTAKWAVCTVCKKEYNRVVEQ